MGDSPYPDMPDIEVSTPGVAKLLAGLNPHKATGPDGISARILKECAKEALVSPLFKKGDRHKPATWF
jgi:hypothetical protein